MNICFESRLDANYMIFNSTDTIPEPMCIQMLKEQQINGVLPVYIYEKDNQIFYQYEITSLHCLSQCIIPCFDQSAIRHMFCSILSIINQSKSYFLCESDFILDPNTIYYDEGGQKLYLAYFSGYQKDLSGQLQRLLEYLMEKINYQSQETVQYVYSLYELLVGEQKMLSVFMDTLLKEALIQKSGIICDTLTRPEMSEAKHESRTFIVKQSEQQQEAGDTGGWELNLLPAIGMMILSGILLYSLYHLGVFQNLFGEFRYLRFFLFVLFCLITSVGIGVLAGVHKKEVLAEALCVTKLAEPKSMGQNKDHQILLLVPRGSSYSTLEIQGFPCYIGRNEDEVDVWISDVRVNRFHAKMTKKDEKYYLMDTKSRYGTYINGKRLKPMENIEVVAGDKIRFASIEYVLGKKG